MSGQIMLGMIAMIIILVISSPSYISSESVLAWKKAQDISSTITGLSMSKDNFETLNQTSLTVVNWRAEIESLGRPIPQYGDSEWFFGRNTTGDYFCLYADGQLISDRWYSIIKKSQEKVGFFSYINENCGATSDFTGTPDLSTLSNISLTIYVGG
jgi:hypothetical protein